MAAASGTPLVVNLNLHITLLFVCSGLLQTSFCLLLLFPLPQI
jgi:hypothetical protein